MYFKNKVTSLCGLEASDSCDNQRLVLHRRFKKIIINSQSQFVSVDLFIFIYQSRLSLACPKPKQTLVLLNLVCLPVPVSACLPAYLPICLCYAIHCFSNFSYSTNCNFSETSRTNFDRDSFSHCRWGRCRVYVYTSKLRRNICILQRPDSPSNLWCC